MDKDLIINILCATDSNFVPYCGIMLTSLFENNKEEQICVYIFVNSSVTIANRSLLKRLSQQYNQQLEFIQVDESIFANNLVSNNQWSNVTYYRLLAPELLPDDVERLIYLDCDIIVNGNIRQMWNTDITNYAISAVPDIWSYRGDVYDRLSIDNDGLYFNAGSIVINLKYWREHNLCEVFLNYLKHHKDRIWIVDQDVLNGVLYNAKMIMSPSFNFQITFFQKSLFVNYSSEFKKTLLDTNSPLIIHYAASTKPWMITYYNMPYLKTWRHYRDISLWKGMKNKLPKSKVFSWLLKRYIFWPLHLMSKSDYILVK